MGTGHPGAHQAGLRTAWINRTGGRYPQTMHPADLEATSLTALARILTDARGHVVAARPLAAATDSSPPTAAAPRR